MIETSKALSPEWVGINHLEKNVDPTKIIWTIAIGDLQAGDIVKVYSHPNASSVLAASKPVPSGGDRVIFPVINLDTTEGSLWLTRTSINKKESSKTELPFKTFAEPAPLPDTAYITVTNNPGANDVVKVGNLNGEDRIIIYLGDNILISDPANESGSAIISGLRLNPNGGSIGIRISRPGKYLNEYITNKDYEAEQAGSDIFAGVPDRVVVQINKSASFYLIGSYKKAELIQEQNDIFYAEFIPPFYSPSEIKVTSNNSYGQGSFTLQVTTHDDRVFAKKIDVYVLESYQLINENNRQVLLIGEGYSGLSLRFTGNYDVAPDKIELLNYDSLDNIPDYINNIGGDNDGVISFSLSPGLEIGHYLLLVYDGEHPVGEASFFVIGETIATINEPENGARINKLPEIKFSSSEELNNNKVKMAIVTEIGDGGFEFLQQALGYFASEEYWFDLTSDLTDGKWEIKTASLSMERFQTDKEYIILLKVNSINGVKLCASKFIYDSESPTLSITVPFEPYKGEENVLSNIKFKMYFLEQVESVADKYIKIWEANDQGSIFFASVNAKSDEVTIEDDFWGNSTVSITIPQLGSNTTYYIEVDQGAFIDLAGNEYAGISKNGEDTWYFTTPYN